MKHKRYLWLGLVPLIPIVVIGTIFGHKKSQSLGQAPVSTPQVITSNFIEPDKVYEVSKFRSGVGHNYSSNAWDGENCVSLKHYINHSHTSNAQGVPTRTHGDAAHPDIKIFAPFDGTISGLENEGTPIGKQIHIRSSVHPAWTATEFHIDLLPGMGVGSKVKSGQQIATIGPQDGTDFALAADTFPNKIYYASAFEAMTDQAFAPWAAKGHVRSDFVLSKEYRAAHPLQCQNTKEGRFVNQVPTPDQFVEIATDPYPNQSDRGAQNAPPPGTLQGPGNQSQGQQAPPPGTLQGPGSQ